MESYEEFLLTLIRIEMQRERCLLEWLRDAQNKISELEECKYGSDGKPESDYKGDVRSSSGRGQGNY